MRGRTSDQPAIIEHNPVVQRDAPVWLASSLHAPYVGLERNAGLHKLDTGQAHETVALNWRSNGWREQIE
ncbi:hypothetical protein ACK8QS_22925 (plasmid) [Ectopseudomonas mendocina]